MYRITSEKGKKVIVQDSDMNKNGLIEFGLVEFERFIEIVIQSSYGNFQIYELELIRR